MAKLTLSLGSNLGDRHQFLARARQLIAERIGPLVRESEIIETPAWGNTQQGEFINQIVVANWGGTAGEPTIIKGPPIRTTLHRILDITQTIEAELGRKRDQHWGPRTIDIDLIFLDDIRYEDERVSLPHPWWRERDFVYSLL